MTGEKGASARSAAPKPGARDLRSESSAHSSERSHAPTRSIEARKNSCSGWPGGTSRSLLSAWSPCLHSSRACATFGPLPSSVTLERGMSGRSVMAPIRNVPGSPKPAVGLISAEHFAMANEAGLKSADPAKAANVRKSTVPRGAKARRRAASAGVVAIASRGGTSCVGATTTRCPSSVSPTSSA